MGDDIRDSVLDARDNSKFARLEDMGEVARVTEADTIYRIDKVREATVLGWLGANWPADWPVQLVMEGISDQRPLTFPARTPVGHTVSRG